MLKQSNQIKGSNQKAATESKFVNARAENLPLIQSSLQQSQDAGQGLMQATQASQVTTGKSANGNNIGIPNQVGIGK